MRLIDADDFMERMKCDTDLCAEMEQDGLKALKKYLDLQPTAYDIGKVVDELQCDRCESCSFIEVCAGSKCCTECHKKIIEIVKQGGVSDDVCEWKFASDGELDGYIENGRYHEQVAKWLEDYKHIKQWKSDIMDSFCRHNVGSFEELVTNTRNKAIDDFVKWLENKKYLMKEIQEHDFCYTHYDELKSNYVVAEYLEEQLKAGEQNENEI